MVKLVSRWLKRASWILLGDGAYACMELARTCLSRNVTLISRLRLDAQLFKFPDPVPKGKQGRKPVKGKRIDLKRLLDDPTQAWQSLTINWYGGELKTLECLSFTCLWYHPGVPLLTLRVMLVKTPGGKNCAETFFSTDLRHTSEQIINWFVLRWNIEVTFEEARAHLGVETQRQWSDKSIQRSTPLLMGLYSLLTLLALKMNETKVLLVQEATSWYDKNGELTFVDIVIAVRRSLWTVKYFSKCENNGVLLKITLQESRALIYQLALAA